MVLTQLRLHNFRCFSTAKLHFTRNTAVVYGDNASGKTSLLEAIFYLAQGRSFRTANPQGLIKRQTNSFRVVGQLTAKDRDTMMGVERNPQQQMLRLAGKSVKSWAAMAQALPVQLIDAEIHRLLAEGPRYRRRFLDWGAFHVEHGFLDCWRRYQRALRQRNEALRRQAPARERQVWDIELAQSGEQLSGLRERYLAKLTPLVAKLARDILLLDKIDLQYRTGWPAGADLLPTLQTHAQRDLQYGNSHYGPHRAEVTLRVDGIKAQENLSRGQHKVLSACLVLAQGRVLTEMTEQLPVLLLDDLAAELDAEHLARFMAALDDQPGQKLFTAITPDSLPLRYSSIITTASEKTDLFHVERGQVHKE